jgi:hypothetical protein
LLSFVEDENGTPTSLIITSLTMWLTMRLTRVESDRWCASMYRQRATLKNFQSKIRHMNEPSLHWYERDLEALQAWDYMYDWKKSLKEFIYIIYINKMYLLFGSTYMRTSVVFGFETLFWCVTFQKVLRKCTSEDKTH